MLYRNDWIIRAKGTLAFQSPLWNPALLSRSHTCTVNAVLLRIGLVISGVFDSVLVPR